MRKILFAAVLLGTCSPAMLWGAVVISVESCSVPYSPSDQTGWLYVYLHSTESPQPKLKSFDLRLSLPSGSGITFLGMEKPANPPSQGAWGYVLPSGAAHTATLDLPSQITVSDVVLLTGNDVIDGQPFTKFQYKIAGGTPIGTYPVKIDTGYTQLFAAVGDYGSQALTYTANNGTIAVPEPGVLAMLFGVGGVSAVFLARRRARFDK